MRTEIYINERSIDVGSEPIALNYSIADINKIQSRNTDFSRTITVPATSVNQQVFGFATDISSLSAKDQTHLLKVRIEVNGITVISGLCKVKSIVSDTFYIEKERLKIKLTRLYDTIKINAECKADTIHSTIKVPYEKIVVKPVSSGGLELKYILLLLALLLLLIKTIAS